MDLPALILHPFEAQKIEIGLLSAMEIIMGSITALIDFFSHFIINLLM